MAVCKQCKLEMKTFTSCLPDPIHIGGRLFSPIRWGAEMPTRRNKRWVVDSRCGDCGTPVGGVHHPGCCQQQCPACRDQALGCRCFDGLQAFRRSCGQARCRAHRFPRHFRR
jgi:hypothetical protein